MNANSLYPVVYDLSEAEYSSQNSTSAGGFCSGGGVDYSFQELLSQEPFPMSLYDVQLLGRDKPKRSGVRRSRSPSLQLTSAAKLTREDVDSRNDFEEPVADGRRIAFDDCFVLTRQVSQPAILYVFAPGQSLSQSMSLINNSTIMIGPQMRHFRHLGVCA